MPSSQWGGLNTQGRGIGTYHQEPHRVSPFQSPYFWVETICPNTKDPIPSKQENVKGGTVKDRKVVATISRMSCCGPASLGRPGGAGSSTLPAALGPRSEERHPLMKN